MEICRGEKLKKQRIITVPKFPSSTSTGYSDGAAQSGKCGSGMAIKLNEKHFLD